MSGRGTNSGTSYQARVAAYLAAYVLASRRLPDWLRRPLVPTSLLFEQGGAGDDIRVSLRDGLSLEIQVKRGLTVSADLAEVFQRFFEKLLPDELGLLVVDRTSSTVIREKLKIELKKWADGLPLDLPKPIASRLSMLSTSAGNALRGRLGVVVLDTAEVDSSDALVAYHVLETVVTDARLAFRVLAEDAHQAASMGTRRDKQNLERELECAGVELITASTDVLGLPDGSADSQASPMVMLNLLLQRDMPAAALELANTLEPSSALPEARLQTARAAAQVALGNARDAVTLLDPVTREQPTYVAAFAHMAAAKFLLGEYSEAAELAGRIVTNAPGDANAWAVYLHYTDDDPPRDPPEHLRNCHEVLVGKAVGMWRRGAPRESVDVLLPIESALRCTPARHFTLAQILRAAAEASPHERRALLTRSFDTAASIADELQDTSGTLPGTVTMFAALVLEELERWDESRSWLERALRYPDCRAGAAIHLAQTELSRKGDPTRASELLAHVTAPEAQAIVLALRARALVQQGATDQAPIELEQALAALPLTPAIHRSETAVAIANAAIDLGYPEVAKSALSEPPATEDLRWFMLLARANASLGDAEAARMLYDRALAAAHPEAAERVRLEYAMHLRRVGDEQSALEILEAAPTPLTTPLLASLLMGRHELKRAEALALPYAESTPAAEWSVRVMATIAAERGDDESAVEWLAKWFSETQSLQAAQTLASGLLRLGREDAAHKVLISLSSESLIALDRLRVACLIAQCGDASRALQLGYSAIHESPHQEEVQLGWVILFLRCVEHRAETSPPDLAGPGIFVSLQYMGRTDPPHGILIGDRLTLQPALDEVAASDTLADALKGKKVGDIIDLRGPPTPLRARIVELRDKYEHAFQWAARTYSRLHPNSEAFREYSVVTENGDYDFSSMHALAKTVAEQHATLRSLYLGHQLAPLGTLAQATDTNVAELYDLMVTADPPRLWVEATSAIAPAPAQIPTRLVVSLSALRTLQCAECRDLLDAITAEIILTPTTFEWLRDERRRLAEGTTRGLKSVAWRDGKPTSIEIPPEQFAAHLEAHEALTEWCARHRRVPRPHDWERERSDDGGREWKRVDLNSFECALIARDESAVLWSDDLGHRALASRKYNVIGASTFRVAFLAHAAGAVTREYFDNLCRRLYALGHWYIPVTESMLESALSEAGEQASTEYRRLLGHLRDPLLQLDVAARLTASALRRLMLAATTPGTDEAIEVTLDAYFSSRERESALQRLHAHIARQFRLIAIDAERCTRIVDHFLHVRL